MDSPLLWFGTVFCACSAAAGLLPLRTRTRLLAMAAALLLAPALVVADNWESSRVADLRDRPAVLAVALAVLAVALAVGVVLARRRPALLAPALIAALPFRIPVDLGGGSANLLLPLYGVIAVGVVAGLIDGPAQSERERPSEEEGWLRWIGAALAGVIVVYALQASYADDVSPALEDVAFFLVPFAALYLLLSLVEWDAAKLRTVVLVLVVEGLVFAAVAALQYATGELFWNDKVISGNEAHSYFRVNSLFFDPNILGRYLTVTMVALAAVVAYRRRRAELIAASAVFVVLLATLVVTFSQSSTIALLGGILVLAAARWGIFAGVGAGALTVVALITSVALIGGGGLSGDTSGRSGLIEGGLEIARDAPAFGTGSGSFPAEFRARFGGGEGFAVESHTEPVTVAAEQGALGLVAYGALLVISLGGLLGACGPRLRGRARGAPLAAPLLAIYAVLVVHSLGYAAFLTDPLTWATLALSAATLAPAGVFATRPRRESAAAPTPASGRPA